MCHDPGSKQVSQQGAGLPRNYSARKTDPIGEIYVIFRNLDLYGRLLGMAERSTKLGPLWRKLLTQSKF